MNVEDALLDLGLELPFTRKLSCPKHSDSDPSLHVYEGDKGWYCFSCNNGGDGWDLLSWFLDKPVGELMRERGVQRGPRPRSRWEMISEVQTKARNMGYDFTVAVRSIAPMGWIEAIAERHDELWPWVWQKEIDESVAPVKLAQELDQIEMFYEQELERTKAIMRMPRPTDALLSQAGQEVLAVRSS